MIDVNKRIFCHTSLWMLIPISQSKDTTFAVCLFLNMISSVCFWHWHEWGGVWHRLDNVLSACTLALTRPVHVMPVLYVLLVLGRICIERQLHDRHLVCHLVFRYIAFWVCCCYVDHFDVTVLVLYSVGYVCHVLFLKYKWVRITIHRSCIVFEIQTLI